MIAIKTVETIGLMPDANHFSSLQILNKNRIKRKRNTTIKILSQFTTDIKLTDERGKYKTEDKVKDEEG